MIPCRLRHGAGETPVWVGRDALAERRSEIADILGGRTVFVLSTPRVRALHGERLAPLVDRALRRVDLEVVEGEGAKSLEVAGSLWREMLAAGGKRDSLLLAFGGGSVGDLGGFVAGCFLRGIPFVQIPTTLLAQVDAAIGGKTGIDLPQGKNTVGLFKQPEAVVCDTGVLATLPREELRSGLVEVIKMGLLLDPPLLDRVERDLDRLLAGDGRALEPVVAAAAAAKIAVVERDETEQGDRKLLNLGHTLGHAIESVLGYQGLRHGEAVAYGILFALRLATLRGLDPGVTDRMRSLLGRFDLPPLPALDPTELLETLVKDKKARETGLFWVLPAALGRGEIVKDLSPAAVDGEIRAFLTEPFGKTPT